MTAPDGRRWTVRQLWLPRVRGPHSADRLGEGDWFAAAIADIGLAGLLLLVGAVLVLVFLPYVFFVLELLVLPLAFPYRVLLHKPWTVAARSGRERRRWQVVGWRCAGEVVHEIAHSLKRGDPVLAPLGSQQDPPSA